MTDDGEGWRGLSVVCACLLMRSQRVCVRVPAHSACACPCAWLYTKRTVLMTSSAVFRANSARCVLRMPHANMAPVATPPKLTARTWSVCRSMFFPLYSGRDRRALIYGANTPYVFRCFSVADVEEERPHCSLMSRWRSWRVLALALAIAVAVAIVVIALAVVLGRGRGRGALEGFGGQELTEAGRLMVDPSCVVAPADDE